MENKLLSINQQLSSIRAEVVSQNRKKLKCMAETVIFCGRQGISLRGHRDDWKDAPNENPGNFTVLLQLHVESGDTILAQHLQSAHEHRNALYTSKTIQNELIDICSNILRENILEEICAARLMDEANNAANDEQLTVSIRNVHSSTRTTILGL